MPKRPKKPRKITKEQFQSWSPEKQQRALNDRRTRIRIEDRALPPEWLARRERARRNRTPITPGSGTTYGDLEKQRKYLEPLTFGEGDRQLSDRTANLAAARQRDANWFAEYRKQVADAQQRSIGAQQQAITGNQQFIDSANQASNASRDQIVAQLQARAGQLGQTSQAPEYQQLADQAAASRAAALANTAQRQVADARTGIDLATAGVTTAGLKDLEARSFRDRQESALDTDKKDYGSKKDAWRAKFIDDAIAEARKAILEDRAFGLKAEDTAADNARQDAAQRQARRNAARQQRNADRNYSLAVQREQRQAANQGRNRKSDRSGPKPATPKETRREASAIRRAVTLIRYMRRAGEDENGVKYTTSNIRAALADKGIDTDVVNTAMDVVYLGGIGKVNRSRWRKAGYNPRDFGQPFK
jgi:hypothetical protein